MVSYILYETYVNVLIIYFALIYFCSYLGYSLECYMCQSETDPGCANEVPDNKYLTNCTSIRQGPKYIACRKLENFVDFHVLDRKYDHNLSEDTFL